MRVEHSTFTLSEEVKLVVQRLDNLLTLLPHLHGFLAALLRTGLIAFLGGANRHVELCDLMSILARGWYLNWTGPVEVEVAKCKGQVLKVHL